MCIPGYVYKKVYKKAYKSIFTLTIFIYIPV